VCTQLRSLLGVEKKMPATLANLCDVAERWLEVNEPREGAEPGTRSRHMAAIGRKEGVLSRGAKIRLQRGCGVEQDGKARQPPQSGGNSEMLAERGASGSPRVPSVVELQVSVYADKAHLVLDRAQLGQNHTRRVVSRHQHPVDSA
jgi:hypothetical protein